MTGLGDYRKDKSVPKPLLEKVEETHEEPKTTKRKTTQGKRTKNGKRVLKKTS
ncbi:MAG: hypothetical protein QM730_10125 [Anaerolineales bacterium]